MKIIQLITRRQRRGAEVFAGQLSDGLATREHDVDLVGLYAPPAEPLVPQHAAPYDLNGVSSLLSARLMRKLARFLDRRQPDLVQANGSSTLKYSVLARVVSRGRWPLVYRNIGLASDWIRHPVHRWWNRWLLHQTDYIASVSEESRQDLLDAFGLPPEQVCTMKRGVDTRTVHLSTDGRQRLQEEGVDADAPIVLHVGSFTPEKNHIWLVDAFEEVRNAISDAQLVLVGDGPRRAAVEKYVEAHGARGYVHLLGLRDDVDVLMAGADLLVLPSTTEGLPGVILEAAAQGTPVVANNVGGVPEAVQHDATGLLVPAGDRSAFCASVVRLLKHPQERLQMGERAQAFVRQHYAMDAVVMRFEQLYEELLQHA